MDTRTGELLIDAGILVGALASLSDSSPADMARFKTAGDRLIAERTQKSPDKPGD